MLIRVFFRNFANRFVAERRKGRHRPSDLKILKLILSVVVWSLLVIYLVVVIGVNTPWGQQYLGRRVAGMLSEKLGTSVTIDRIEYGVLSHVTLHDVLIKDQQGVEMLRANRLSTRIELLPLAEGKVSVATAQLF